MRRSRRESGCRNEGGCFTQPCRSSVTQAEERTISDRHESGLVASWRFVRGSNLRRTSACLLHECYVNVNVYSNNLQALEAASQLCW
jgi:hypothetical protein